MKNENRGRLTGQYKCLVCKDIGYIFREIMEEDGYAHEVAAPCPKCGSARAANDQRALAGIPEKFFEVSFPVFQWQTYRENVDIIRQQVGDFVDNFEDWRDARLGLFIWSSRRGTGKSMLASAISNSLILKYGLSLRFVSVPEYLETVKKGFNRQPEETDKTLQFFDVDVLVIDDLGAEKTSDWQRQELFRLLDSRYLQGKTVIVTSNFSVADLPIDTRLTDRLYESCVQIHLPEQSVRAERADERKRKFLSRNTKEGVS